MSRVHYSFLFIIFAATLSFLACVINGYGDDIINPKDAGHFDDNQSRARLPGVWLPTGASIFVGTLIGNELNIDIGVEGKYTIEAWSHNGGADPNEVIYLTPRLGVQFGALEAGLQLNLMNAIMKLIESDLKKNGEVISNGLVARPTPEFLEKIWVSYEIFSSGEEENLAISLQIGRQAATPLGVFVLPYRASMSIIDSQKLDQVDLIALNFNILRNTAIEFVLFKNISQENNPSFAVNFLQKINPFEIFFSYARLNKDFENVNQVHKRDQQEKFEAGIRYTYEGFKLSVEAGYSRSLTSNQSDEGFVSVHAAYEIPKTSLTPFVAYERLQSIYKNETGNLVSLGLRCEILENLDFTIEGEGIFRDHGGGSSDLDKEDYAIMTGFTLTPRTAEFDLSSISEVEHE